jgi:hypothetical protein
MKNSATKSVLLTAAFILLSVPAFAGTVNFSNGQGVWQSTICPRPVSPAFVGMGGEVPASTMNNAANSFNKFVTDTQSYMDCLAQEARADTTQSSQLIVQSMQQQMNAAQEEVNTARAQMFGRK